MDSSDPKDKPSVPKFSSFKLPAATSEPQAHAVHRRRSTREPESRRSRHSSHGGRSDSTRRSDRPSRERSHERSDSSRRRRQGSPERRHQSRTHTKSSKHRPSSEKLRSSGTVQTFIESSRYKGSPSSTGSPRIFRPHLTGETRTPSPPLPAEILMRIPLSLGSITPDTPSQPEAHGSNKHQTEASADLPFFIDLQGDEGVRKYGMINQWVVPKYRRSGGGYVLGMGMTHKIDRDQSIGDAVVLRSVANPDSSRKPKTESTLSQVAQLPLPTFRIAHKGSSQLDSSADYIPMDADDWGEPRAYRFGPEIYQEYDSINQILTSYYCPSDPETETDRERTEAIDLDAERKARSAMLWRTVKDSPKDVGGWLRLIDHQDMLILGARDESERLTRDERQSLADVKLSLYEKALGKVGDSPHKDRLLLGRLQTGAQLWSSQKLSEQWKATLRDNPQFISLWVKYLDFSQTDSPDFTFQQCLATHKECLKIVASASLADTSVQTYVFLRLTIMYREAGYHELAVGLWQAVLEFCCFKADAIESTDDALNSFRQFWESESPRIGEEGAKGWNNELKPEVDPIITQFTQFTTEVDSSSIIKSWTEAERERMEDCRRPGRSLDASIPKTDDPYRVVLFSDVAEIVPLFGNFNKSDELIDAFLYFSQLPHLAFPSNLQSTRLWNWDNFLRNEFVEDYHLDLRCWQPPQMERWKPQVKEDGGSPPMEIMHPLEEEECKPALPFLYPLPNFLHTTETLFTDPTQWFYSFHWWGDSCPVQPQLKRRELAQRTLQLLIHRHPEDEELAEYSLAFEFTCNPGAAKKIAKRLLKDRPSMLRLWNALAMMELRSNSKEKALEIWSTALALSFKWKEPKKYIQRSFLWQSWVWHYIEQGDNGAASYILHSISNEKIDPTQIPKPDQEPPFFSPTTTVKSQRLFGASQEDALHLRNPHAYAASTDCMGLIYYLMEWPFKSAIDIYDDAVKKLQQLPSELEDFKAFTAELLHQARARLLCRHMQRDPHMRTWKPVEFRNILQESIALFPHNTIFSTLCMWNESRMLRIDRLRNIDNFTRQDPDKRYQLDQMVSTAVLPQSIAISTYLLPIWTEISTRGNNSGEYWIVRPLFEKALGEVLNPTDFRAGDAAVRARFGVHSARSNLTIWKLYVLYELYHVKDVAAAKAVFFRAIQACPWSKELIMFAFEHLRGDILDLPGSTGDMAEGLSVEELRRLFLILDERQLRLHLNIKDDLVRQAAEEARPDEEMEDAPPIET